MFKLILISLVIGSLTACGSSGSGVSSSKKITELDSSEREKLCSYITDVEGAGKSKMCGDGITISVQSTAECAADLTAVSATCTATVDNAESCAEAAGDDLCNLLSSPACSFLFMCAGD